MVISSSTIDDNRLTSAGPSSDLTKRLRMDEQTSLQGGQRGARTLALLFGQCRGHVLFEPIEMLPDDLAHLLVVRCPGPEVGWSPARHARHARKGRNAQRTILVEE